MVRESFKELEGALLSIPFVGILNTNEGLVFSLPSLRVLNILHSNEKGFGLPSPHFSFQLCPLPLVLKMPLSPPPPVRIVSKCKCGGAPSIVACHCQVS